MCVWQEEKVAKVIVRHCGKALGVPWSPLPVVVYIIKHLIYWQSFLPSLACKYDYKFECESGSESESELEYEFPFPFQFQFQFECASCK